MSAHYPADAAARMRALAAGPTGGAFTDNHEPSMWLRTRLVDLRTRLATADPDNQCGHLLPGDVGTIALWAPDRAVCSNCAKSLKLTGDADRTCDRCGIVAGGIHPEIVAPAPSVLVIFGLCPSCHRREITAESGGPDAA